MNVTNQQQIDIDRLAAGASTGGERVSYYALVIVMAAVVGLGWTWLWMLIGWQWGCK